MQSRLIEFDKLRGLAIVGVVIIHSAVHCRAMASEGLIGDIILVFLSQASRFAVPAFCVISGFFITREEVYGGRNSELIAYRRLKRVIPPYIIWSCLYYALFVVTGEAYATHQSLIVIFLEKLATGTVGWQLFFLVMIAQCYALCLLGVGRKGKFGKLSLVLLIGSQVLFIVFNYVAELRGIYAGSIPGFILGYFKAFSRSFFPMYVGFFVFGRWLGANYEDLAARLRRHKYAISMAAVLSYFVAMAEFFVLSKWTGGAISVPPDWNLTNNIFAFLLVLCLTMWLKGMKWNRADSKLVWLGKLSFIIFLLHEPLLGYVLKTLEGYTPVVTKSPLILFPVSVVLGIFLSVLCYDLICRFVPKHFQRYLFG